MLQWPAAQPSRASAARLPLGAFQDLVALPRGIAALERCCAPVPRAAEPVVAPAAARVGPRLLGASALAGWLCARRRWQPLARARARPQVCAAAGAGEAAALLGLAERFVNEESAFYSPAKPDRFAEDFVFRGPTVGPLNKADYLATLGTFQVYRAFPDIQPNAFGFVVDPDSPRLVRFFVRNTGTNTGPFGLGDGIDIPPSGREVRGATEAFSVLFDEDHRVKQLTVGYVCDRFEGNTRGLGAALGLFQIVGLPIQPGALYNMATFLNNRVLGMKAKTVSAPEDVPAWWPHPERGAEGYL